MAILRSTPRQPELIPILCAIANFDLESSAVDQLLGLEEGETQLLLRGLHSLLAIPSDHRDKGTISVYHASFLDFLDDDSRSRDFYVGPNRREWPACAGGSRRPYLHLIPFLASLPPSAELCPLIARMEPDCIFALDHDNLGDILSWLQRIPTVPPDLIELWEDYVYMASMKRDTWLVKRIESLSPEFCQVLVTKEVLFYHGFRGVCSLLDMTWDELRTTICSVRPDTASDEPGLSGQAQHILHALISVDVQRTTCRDIALKCIRRMAKGCVDNDDMGGE
ncbi:NACHT domain-containing protein [Mycena sanguinolenta]|uniref:NACHT domain-containing protein n=1 Tax=Mycena sanguinolenta TaxID=230812 RepID=A0A8H6Z835_9AGAR|nr:NACHT domain-containing protein [Mycena sanguinolenta]